ncbi:TIM barrel protein [Gimesia sp.]|mgnify:FL=1|uniref:hydroxypyruvate isomerase family protein n=1 Tax=Gimesia sp. TaxID=2024833 RepID=UPI000C584BF1|nr:TIM barrel protein [Gimesia sp.]MAX37508.1 xylose isomerase [Gimesia sp.]HAH48945.1 xylose isomerase [Planctomycetaceae bacterium]HBL45772.1 xylose isomerase [Planctomycetaceae bacterium]|tara:strand:- start:8399 stop:9322 length:924 start_codon:yes stop_codon:yes gene_type:complete
MQRRDFLKNSVVAGSAALFAGTAAQAAEKDKPKPFQLKYGPHFGMFKNAAGNDPLDQLKFAADQGFTAWEDNGMKKKPKELQQQIADTMEKLNMQMGVFVAHGSIGKTTFTRKDKNVWDSVLKEIKESVEVAKRVNAKWMTVVPGNLDEGPRSRLAEGYQTANVIELLRRCADIFEPHGMVMVLEPLNWYANHGGVFLQGSPQAYALCKAVDSPSCKILFDIYHQQITEGNLIVNIDNSWDEIGYFQSGDNPGRKEPGTGEINYLNVFKHIHSKGFEGIIGMEHGNSKPGKEGDLAVIEAYREVDRF